MEEFGRCLNQIINSAQSGNELFSPPGHVVDDHLPIHYMCAPAQVKLCIILPPILFYMQLMKTLTDLWLSTNADVTDATQTLFLSVFISNCHINNYYINMSGYPSQRNTKVASYLSQYYITPLALYFLCYFFFQCSRLIPYTCICSWHCVRYFLCFEVACVNDILYIPDGTSQLCNSQFPQRNLRIARL